MSDEKWREVMSDDDSVYVWPDGSWCYEDELEEALTYKSDDYQKIPRRAEGTSDCTCNG